MFRAPSWLGIVWVVVGVAVAAINDYFDNLNSVGRVISAILAVILWPIILLGFDITVRR
jgi:uncharacterized membrane protein YkvI